MAIVKEYLKITPDLRVEITNRFHITRQALWKILSNRSNSARAKEIRKYAEERGGKWIVMIPVDKSTQAPTNNGVFEPLKKVNK